MQGLNSSQGSNQGGTKQGGLSWSSPQGTQGASTSPLLSSTKPAAQPTATAKSTATTTNTSRSRTMPENTTTRTAGLLLAGVVAGALLVWGWSVLNPSTTTPTNTNSTAGTTNTSGGTATNSNGTGVAASTTPSTLSNAGEIDVATQAAGSQVVVTDATVSAPTWLVVYELANGVPVRALGATMFFPAYNGKGGIITLVRPTEPNTSYFVGQSLDTGDHTFTPHVNKEVTDSSGRMVGTTFKTQ